ncbi:27 kDa antigen Cfp30B [Corynebacterium atrinae]|uniref:VOC family protein n=1 Tax=Corynebacterium atrinae TaxID=1336740 RepID=UPI0025B4BF1C|nr:VOC family protein [Corynebacterium atrinae]WJY62256.1 27 kDa antigen Cfp30B [Corynebacterium atrinae]
MPAFEAIGGMPYWIDLTTSDVRKSAAFYSEILGWEISGEDYRVARVQGLPVAGFIPQPADGAPMPDTWITYFLADNLEEQITQVVDLGGRVLAEPTEVQLGRMAVLVDAAGALFGLIEPAGEDSFVAAGEPGTPVWHELTATTGFNQAIDFYHGLFDWELVSMEVGEDFTYSTAMLDGAAFAGIWKAEGNFPPQVPSFWQTYLGVLDLDAVVAKVPELGGEVIREPWDSEFGRMCLVSDSTGATLTLCEVDEPMEEGRESDPLEGFDL